MPFDTPQALIRDRRTVMEFMRQFFVELDGGGNEVLKTPTVQVNTRSRMFSCGPGGDINLQVSTTQYDAGDCVGGLLELPLATKAGESGIVQSLTVIDRGATGTAYDIAVYNCIPDTGEYTFADHEPFGGTNVLGFKVEQMAGYIPIATTDWKTKGQALVAMPSFNPFVFNLRPGVTSLYIAIHSIGTPTFSIDTNLSVQLGLLID